MVLRKRSRLPPVLFLRLQGDEPGKKRNYNKQDQYWQNIKPGGLSARGLNFFFPG